MPSNHLILCRPLLLPPSVFPSIRVFSNESVLHIKWPKYCHFSFSISPSNEYSGLISFRLDLLAVHGVAKSWTQLSDWTELKCTNMRITHIHRYIYIFFSLWYPFIVQMQVYVVTIFKNCTIFDEIIRNIAKYSFPNIWFLNWADCWGLSNWEK